MKGTWLIYGYWFRLKAKRKGSRLKVKKAKGSWLLFLVQGFCQKVTGKRLKASGSRSSEKTPGWQKTHNPQTIISLGWFFFLGKQQTHSSIKSNRKYPDCSNIYKHRSINESITSPSRKASTRGSFRAPPPAVRPFFHLPHAIHAYKSSKQAQ